MYANVSAVPRCSDSNFDVNSYPRFPLKNTEPIAYLDTPTDEEKSFLSSLDVDEYKLNKIEEETREKVTSERWKEERKFRFIASRFHLISRRQRNHENFAKEMIHPKEFTSRHTSHGRNFEGTAIHEYQKFMNARKTPVVVLKCGLVISKKCQSLQPPLMETLLILVVVSHLEFWKLNAPRQNLQSPHWMLVLIQNFSPSE